MNSLHVICKIGETDYAVSADDVAQMESFTGATPVPGTPPYVLGLMQVRQQIIAVVDGRTRFGLPARAPSLESRVVVVSRGQRLVGILVDSAREVQHLNADQILPAPELVAKQSTGFVKGVARAKNRLLMLLDTSKLIDEETANGLE